MRKWFEGEVEIPVPQRFKPQNYVYYEWYPHQDTNYKKLDTFIEALHGLYHDGIWHGITKGQPTTSIELYTEKKRSTYIMGFPYGHHDYLAQRLRYTYKGSGIQQLKIPPIIHGLDDVVMASFKLKHHPFKTLNLGVKGEFTEALLNAHDLVEEDEILWTQILVEPADTAEVHNELESKYQLYLSGEEIVAGVGLGQLIGKGLKAAADAPKKMVQQYVSDEKQERKIPRLPATEQKLKESMFRVKMQVLAKSGSSSRQSFLLNSVANAFKVLSGDNVLQMSQKWKRTNQLFCQNTRKMSPFGDVLLLSHNEIKSLYQTPTKDMESETLETMTPEEKGIDKRLTKEGIHIGYAPHDDNVRVHIPMFDPDDAAKVRAWISSPGGGKSTQIEAFTEGAASLGHGFAVYDGKDGVMFHRTLSTLSAKHNEERFEIIDYENEKRPQMFNFNALGGEGQSAGSMFAELFELLFSGKELITSKSFAIKCAQSVFSDPMSTFLEFIQMMRDDDFRTQFIPKLRKNNPDLYLWWKQEFPKISNNELNRMIRPILDRMENDILYNSKMSGILCGRGGVIDYYRWMQDGKLVFVNAPLGCFTEPELRFVMALHNFASWNATLSRRRITQTGQRALPYHLLYDEPQNYMDATPTIQTAIAKARAYSVSYNFFIQEAEQIIEKSPSLWKTIMGMSPMLMIGPVSEHTARLVSKELDVSVDDILRIKHLSYHWWYKAYASKAAVKSQIIRAVTPIDKLYPPQPLTDRSQLKQRHAYRHGPMSAQEIQEDISARNFKLSVVEYRKLLASYDNEEREEEGVEWVD